jgi:hypothetical protein
MEQSKGPFCFVVFTIKNLHDKFFSLKRAWLKNRTCVPKHYGAQAQKDMHKLCEFPACPLGR